MDASEKPPSSLVSRVTSRLPRVHVERAFLSPDDHAALLAETLAAQSQYRSSSISRYRDDRTLSGGQVDPTVRNSHVRKLPKAFASKFREKLFSLQDTIQQTTGVQFPHRRGLEIEAVHSGDGALFTAHIDTNRGPQSSHRVISAVYYYSQTPAAFSGGQLRLFSLDRSASRTIEPENNTMVIFPSMFLHEVLPVSVPSGEWKDGRFSVNCWVHRTG